MEFNLQLEHEEKIVNPFLYLRSKCIENGKVVSTRKLEQLMDGAVNHSHISELEHGVNPTLSQLKAYHNFFGVSYDFLMGETTNVYTTEGKELSEFEKAIFDFSIAKEPDEKLIWQTIQMLLSTEKGYAILYYLSQYLYERTGYSGYRSKNGTIYCYRETDEKEKSAKFAKIMECLKKNTDNLSYQELRLYVENIIRDMDKS